MTRRANLGLWAGCLIVFASPFLYLMFLIRFDPRPDLPWAMLLMFLAGFFLMGRGLRRAWREPLVYRGRIAGSIALILGVALVGLVGYGVFVGARQLPPSPAAPRIGQTAPDFTLPDATGAPVTLSKLLARPGSHGAVLIFYRGFW